VPGDGSSSSEQATIIPRATDAKPMSLKFISSI
jgi:hypothetical protein